MRRMKPWFFFCADTHSLTLTLTQTHAGSHTTTHMYTCAHKHILPTQTHTHTHTSRHTPNRQCTQHPLHFPPDHQEHAFFDVDRLRPTSNFDDPLHSFEVGQNWVGAEPTASYILLDCGSRSKSADLDHPLRLFFDINQLRPTSTFDELLH